jgi:hypothetical protein
VTERSEASGELVPAPEDPADAVARAVLACPVVAGLADEGLATYLPGRRVAGVRLDDDRCEVAVVLRLDGRTLPELAEEVREAAAGPAGGRPVDVVVTDVVTADESGPR